jgi:hypothetical protein
MTTPQNSNIDWVGTNQQVGTLSKQISKLEHAQFSDMYNKS